MSDDPEKQEQLQYQEPILPEMKKYRISAPLVVPAAVGSEEELKRYIPDYIL